MSDWLIYGFGVVIDCFRISGPCPIWTRNQNLDKIILFQSLTQTHINSRFSQNFKQIKGLYLDFEGFFLPLKLGLKIE